MSTRAQSLYMTSITTVKVTTTTTTTITASSSVTRVSQPTPEKPNTHARSPFPAPEELLVPKPGQAVEGYYLVTVGSECGIFFSL